MGVCIYHTDALILLAAQQDSSASVLLLADVDDVTVVHAMRILKPGGIVLMQSHARRLVDHGRMLQDGGLNILDCVAWLNPDATETAFGMTHLAARTVGWTDEEKEGSASALRGLKTPNLRKTYVPFLVAQKPVERNMPFNQIQHGVGLVTSQHTACGGARRLVVAGNAVSTHWEGSYATTFLLPRLGHPAVNQDAQVRIWHHLLSTFSHAGNVIVDVTGSAAAALACSAIGQREYHGCVGDKATAERWRARLNTFVAATATTCPEWTVIF
jgi:hypothetical protein